jgi:hypothetical protein
VKVVNVDERPDFVGGAIGGAILGFVFALFALLIGLVRAVIYLATDGALPALRPEDTVMLAYYVGGFIVAGTVVGAAGVFFPSRAATYGRFALGGMVVMLAIVLGDGEAFTTIDSFDWGMIIVLGAVFGMAAARGWLGGS